MPLAGIAAASAAALIAFTCAAGTARSHLDAQGTLRADLATDQPRFDWTNGGRQLALNGAGANLLLNSAAPASLSVGVSAQAYALSFPGTGSTRCRGRRARGRWSAPARGRGWCSSSRRRRGP